MSQAGPWFWVALCSLVALLALGVISRQLLIKRTRKAFEEGLQQQAMVQAQERTHLQEQLAAVQQQFAAERVRLEVLDEQLNTSRSELANYQTQLMSAQSEVAAANARQQEMQRSFAEKEALFRQSSAQLKQEFELLANRVFDAQGEKHQASLQTVLTPFKDQIVDFKKRVEEVYHADTKERASLLAEVKNLQTASERINAEAENLTKALKGDKKIQGNWGELVLERVLEESGLRKDHEYVLQSSHRNEQGDLKRPDVLIRLPDNKDVVVDAKVTLNAYEEALACEDELQREQLLRQHLQNLRNHVKRLSEQDYDQLRDVRSLDFVLLFVPIESAFTLAMQLDHKLFTDAFTQRIVVVSPTTLMMTLRIINNVWRYEKQNRNAQEIARRAGALYDKLRLLMEEMDKLGKQLATADKTYQSVYAKLATGKGNLVRQVSTFRDLGAAVKTPMDTKLVERASDDPDQDGIPAQPETTETE